MLDLIKSVVGCAWVISIACSHAEANVPSHIDGDSCEGSSMCRASLSELRAWRVWLCRASTLVMGQHASLSIPERLRECSDRSVSLNPQRTAVIGHEVVST